jgi:hypothetical protein
MHNLEIKPPWKPGERPQLSQQVIEGDIGLS